MNSPFVVVQQTGRHQTGFAISGLRYVQRHAHDGTVRAHACEKCRTRGPGNAGGPYCTATPCPCVCHATRAAFLNATRPEPRPVVIGGVAAPVLLTSLMHARAVGCAASGRAPGGVQLAEGQRMNAGAIVEHTETGDVGRIVEVWEPFERVHFEPMVRVYWVLTRGRAFHPEARERLVRTAVLRSHSGVLR